jgi:hypothetical protein
MKRCPRRESERPAATWAALLARRASSRTTNRGGASATKMLSAPTDTILHAAIPKAKTVAAKIPRSSERSPERERNIVVPV